MKLFVKASLQMLKENWFSLLVFELTYRIFSMILLVKGSGLALDICLNSLGYSYLTAENYDKFITCPLTILFIVIGLFFICLALAFEVGALFSCYEASWSKRKISVPSMILSGSIKTWRFIRRYPVKWFLYTLACSPYLGIHFLVWEVSQTQLLQFSLQEVFTFLQHYYLLGFLGVLIFLASMLFSFTLPRRIMTNDSPKEIRQECISRMKTGWKRDLLFSALVQIAAALIMIVLFFLSILVMVAGVKAFKSQSNMVSSVLFYGSLIKYSIGVIAGGIGTTFTLLYLYTFFARSIQKKQCDRPRTKKRSIFRQVVTSRFMVVSLTALIILSEAGYLLVEAQTSIPILAASQQPVAVTAHRGGARMAPENTLSSMKYAAEAMADFAEIDVQETKDGEIVLLHDTNLKRTTGLNANIWDLTFDEVRQLDAGVKFNKKFRGEQVPTLDEVIKYCKGKIRLNIEVKYNGHNKNIVKKVVKIIEENDFADYCVLTSMNYKFLAQAKELNKNIVTGYTLRMTYGDLSQLDCVDFFSVKHTYVDRQFVEAVHKMGKEVHVWTLNYQGDMQRMVSLKTDNIITDSPELVRKVILGETDRNPSFFALLKYAIK